MNGTRLIRILLPFLVIGGFSRAAAPDLARQVLIVYNEVEPAGKALADYYAGKRGVPTNQICAIHVRNAETISHAEFNSDIREPILRFLTRNGLWQQEPRSGTDPKLGEMPTLVTVDNKISFVALMYGVPLRIEPDPSAALDPFSLDMQVQRRREEASVDSELALLPTMGSPVAGPLGNPFYGRSAMRFDAPLNRAMVLVGRLDGPDPQTVRRMIDDAVTVERHGLLGRAYFDSQGMHGNSHAEGDDWLRASYRLFRDAGFDSELDESPDVFGQDYPMTAVAVYAGWYTGDVTGPFRRETFRFRPGGIGYHIHSFSGASVRTTQSYWVGPLLAKGAAVSMGNVYEPSLTMTPHVDIFFRRLLDGATFLEAAYASQPVLSWQTTFAGDPLYRPFGLSLDEQIERLEADKSPDLPWAYLRKVNLLIAQSRLPEAEKLCRAKAEMLSSNALYEKLGDVSLMMHRVPSSIAAYKQATLRPTDSYQYIRVAIKLAAAYETNEQPRFALTIYDGLATAYPNDKHLIEYFRKARDIASKLGDQARADSWQAKIDKLMGVPQPAQSEKQ